MKGSIRRKKLVDALKAVKPGLAGKELIEQSTKFAIVKGAIVTYNDEISVRYPLPELGDQITGAVSSAELYALVDKLPYKVLRFELKDSELVLSSGRVKAGLVLEAEVRLPFEEVDSDRQWVDVPKSFLKALKFVVPACSHDLSLLVLTCVYCDADRHRFEATDTIRYARHEFEEFEDQVESFLLSGPSARELLAYKFEQMSVGESWVHFRTKEGAEVSCRRVDGKYPPTAKFDFEGREIPLPKDLVGALERSHVLANQSHELNEEAEVQMRRGRFNLRARGSAGWIDERLRCAYKGSPVNFKTNPMFLADACRRKSVAVLGEDKLRFEGEDWVYVVALVT